MTTPNQPTTPSRRGRFAIVDGQQAQPDAQPVQPTQLQPTQPAAYFYADERENSLYYVGLSRDGVLLPAKRISSYLEVLANTHGTSGKNHGVYIAYNETINGAPRLNRIAIAQKDLLGDGLDFLRFIVDSGVKIVVGCEKRLLEYLRSAEPTRYINSVDTVGWHGDDEQRVFVLPSRIYGANADSFVYQPEAMQTHRYSVKGDLQEWQTHVARYAVGNSRLAFAISSAFAGTLLNLAETVDGGGFHFYGSSSIGKSSTLAIAASVWGRGGKVEHRESFIRKWAATATAIEFTATLHNDTTLLLDELGECDEKQAAKIPYMLGNGAGKERGNKTLTNRPLNTFRLLFLSNGEHTLESHLMQKGVKTHAGQELRMLSIPADAGQGMGVVENLQNFSNPAQMIETLVRNTTRYYGTAGSAWLEHITQNSVAIQEQLPNAIQHFKTRVVPENATSQVNRAVNRFALVAAAGEAATAAGITGWQAGEAIAAAQRCFNDWLAEFGGAAGSSREEQKILDAIESYIDSNRAKFMDDNLSLGSVPPPDIAGYYRDEGGRREYWILPAKIREIARSDPKTIGRALQRAGWSNNSAAVNKRIRNTGNKPTRVFVVRFPD